MRFDKHKQNLRKEENLIWSYSTIVAKVVGNELHQIYYGSRTTQRHINYVAEQLELTLIKM